MRPGAAHDVGSWRDWRSRAGHMLAMRRPGELLFCTGYSFGSFRLRDHCFGTLYRGTEFLALPSVNLFAVIVRLVAGLLRA